jgi:hypothetical protein
MENDVFSVRIFSPECWKWLTQYLTGTAGEHCAPLSLILLLRIANGGEGASGTHLARNNYHLPPW